MDRRGIKYNFMGRQVPVTNQWLCSTHLTEKQIINCHCDKECVLFGDCCVDSFETFLLTKDYTSVKEFIEDPETLYAKSNLYNIETCYLSLYHKYSSCHELNVNNSIIQIKVIDTCPESYSQTLDPLVQAKCINTTMCALSSIPATLAFSKQWQVVFRNVFCALCHGLDKEDVVLWGSYAKCYDKLNLTNADDAGNAVLKSCTGVYYLPRNVGRVRHCIKDRDLKSKCEATSANSPKEHNDRLACPAYIAPVKFNAKQYKNIHCAYCNKHSKTEFDKLEPIIVIEITTDPNFVYPIIMPASTMVQPGLIPTFKPTTGGAHFIRQPSLKVLFDFSFLTGFRFNVDGTSEHVERHPCTHGSVYDYISNKCKPVFCPFGQEWVDGLCKYKEIQLVDELSLFPKSSVEDEALILSIVTKTHKSHNINATVLLHGYIHKLKEIFTKHEEGIKNRSDSGATETFSVNEKRLFQNSDAENITFFAELHMHLGDDENFNDLINCVTRFRRLISKGNINRLVDIQDVSLSNRKVENTYSCTDERHLRQLPDITFDTVNNTVYLINRQVNVGYHALVTRFSFRFLPDSSKPLVQQALICSLLQCPQMKLSADEYVFINDTLQMKTSGERLLSDQYEFRNGTIFVCIPEKKGRPIPGFYKHLHSARIIQMVTSILSLTALGVTIMIYIKSASLKTLHGKTLVSLSVSLIGAQLAGLLENESSEIFCKIIAIVMHFSWLAAFGWMSMISYDMLRTFFGRQTTVTNTHSDRKRYFIYSLIGWVLPASILVVCIILDNVIITEIWQPGYARDGVCFIVSDMVRLVFFQVPFVLSVLFNTLAFVLTVYSISTKRKANPHSKRSSDRLYSFIYLKLSVVMGVTWLFVILASITNQPVFWYLHLVLNGLQGVFVFISFALRTALWKKIKIKKPRIVKFRCKDSTLYSISGSSSLHY